MLTPKEFVTQFKVAEKDFSYAQAETWVVSDASTALSYLMSVARQEMYMQEQSDSREIIRMMKDLSVFISDQIDEMDDAVASTDMIMYKEAKSQFLTTKEGEEYRWTMITASAFEDRDGEIISEKAFEDDCNQMELTGDYGELLWWHSDGDKHKDKEGNEEKEARPYIPLGSCDTSFVAYKCNIESGLYYDPVIGKAFSEKASKFGASKSFYHKEEEPVEGVYTYIRTKERSLLPRGKEANLLTKLFGLSKEKEMATNDERIAAFAKNAGLETKEQALDLAKELSAKAEKFGLKNKEAEIKTEDEKTEVKEVEGMKEFTETLTAMKEANTVAFKELKDAFEVTVKELKETQTKEMDALKTDLGQVQGAVAALLGFQPKGANKFVASEKGKAVELTEEQKIKAKEAEGLKSGFEGLSDWIVTGTRQVAA